MYECKVHGNPSMSSSARHVVSHNRKAYFPRFLRKEASPAWRNGPRGALGYITLIWETPNIVTRTVQGYLSLKVADCILQHKASYCKSSRGSLTQPSIVASCI